MAAAHRRLVVQFFVHTETVGTLARPIEFLFNTPSHHRVHHGSDPEYLDKNYGGILILWDRLFGRFQPELHRPTYGLTEPVDSYNLLHLQHHEYGNILRDVRGHPLARQARLPVRPARLGTETGAVRGPDRGAVGVAEAPRRPALRQPPRTRLGNPATRARTAWRRPVRGRPPRRGPVRTGAARNAHPLCWTPKVRGKEARVRKNPATVGIAPGDGLIARFGAVVVYLAGETASTDRILGAIEAVASGDHPGAAIAHRLAAVVFGTGSEPPPFGVVAPTGDGTVILLRGPVTAEIQGAEGVRKLSGARAFTWVDEIVREPVRRIAISGNDAPAHPRSDLRGGVVPGGGFEWRVGVRRAGDADKPARPSTTATPVPGEPPATAPAGLEALADESETRPAGEPRGTQAMPLAWSQTGLDRAAEPIALQKNPPTRGARIPPPRRAEGAETPTGALVYEDSVYPLDRPYVIGRNPDADDSVRNAIASPLAVPRDRHVSRVHAYVSLDRGKVFVRDAATPAGTFIAAPGVEQWTRVGTAPVELPPGWSIRIGEKVLTHRNGERHPAAQTRRA
ncbi:FHA domain-containing protein [Nocardia puris]|uniref:FHA domain-containing protein n=2 Tax=Nocardia puris TaxID=208602 RepID=A0A366DGR7_9NOCA|nr:FHA domain-containing protein [Nocardia puris]